MDMVSKRTATEACLDFFMVATVQNRHEQPKGGQRETTKQQTSGPKLERLHDPVHVQHQHWQQLQHNLARLRSYVWLRLLMRY